MGNLARASFSRYVNGHSSEPEQNGRADVDVDFEELFRRYAPRIRAIALNRTCDQYLAEDIVQETLLKAYRYRSALDRNRPAWPWLSRIASNVCNDLMRGASRDTHRSLNEISEPETEIPEGSPDPADRYAEHEVLAAALGRLNHRHRRILLLSSEGWNHGDIADLEGISYFAVQSTLQRARRRFRQVYGDLARENGHSPDSSRLGGRGVPSVLLLPQMVADWGRRLRQRARSAGNQVANHLSNAGSLMNSTASSLTALFHTVAAALVATSMAVGGTAPALEAESLTATRSSAVSPAAAPSSQKPKPEPTSLTAAPVEVAERFAHGAVNELNPYSEKTPEQTWFRSIAASPNYEDDHTVFASGTCNLHSTCNALWISQDGGATWDRLPARNFLGGPGQILLSPDWSRDGRMYSFDWKGIQLSVDGGDSWLPRLVLPWGIDRAGLSPHYSADDRRLVLSTSLGLMDYWPESGMIEPADLGLPPGSGYRILGRSPTHAAEPALYLSDGVTLYECGSPCRAMARVSGLSEVNEVTPSPAYWRDGILLGRSNEYQILVATEDGSFEQADSPHKFSNGISRSFYEVAVAASDDGPPIAIASTWVMPDRYDAVYRSLDGGITWTPSRIDLEGFHVGTEAIAVTPTGRMFAGARYRGIACSEDGGITWAARCSPER